jgi:6-phosphofructokinase 2
MNENARLVVAVAGIARDVIAAVNDQAGLAALGGKALGQDGAVLIDEAGEMRMPALNVIARSAVGAGDSFVAAMTLWLARGASARSAFLWGMAAGAAAVLTPGTQMCRREDVERLHQELVKRT